MSEDKKTIIIDLTTSTSDKALDDGTALIQARAFDAITKQVNAELSAVKKSSTSKNPKDSQRMVFFIDGTRGAGKSTFLRSVTKELTTTDTKNNPDNNRLELLIELDPTKVGTGEHSFVSLLYALNKLVKAKQDCRSTSSKEDEYEAWRKQFKKLAGGLQLLDETKNPLKDIDAEAFLDSGLERAESGMEFADEFKALIEKSCQLLKKDALVISIDDADTNFRKGQEILEMIRRYLDSPYLVILITGDLQLYSHIVRDFYYESLGRNVHDRDGHRKEEQKKLMDHLENQYLTKLFPLHQRTHLTSLWDLKTKDNYEVKFDNSGTQQPEQLDDIIDRLLKEGLYIKGERDLNLYKEFLLKQPLRSIIQLLQHSTQNIKGGRFTSDSVAEGTRAAFRGNLHTHQVDVNALGARDMNSLNDAVFRVVLEDGEFDTGCYLRPQPSKESLRNSFVALAAEVAHHCKGRPDYAINYILQGLGSIALYGLISGESWDKLVKEKKEQQFKSYLSIGRNENTLNWARHASGILAGNGSGNKGVGVILLKQPELDISQLLVFALSRVNVTDGNKTQTYASIFNILGIVVRLLEIGHNNEILLKEVTEKEVPDELKQRQSLLTQKVTDELKQRLSLLTVSEPPWKEGRKGDNDTSSSAQQNIIDPDLGQLANNIVKWLKFTNSIKSDIKPSAVFLGKVWTRLYFSLLNASASIDKEGTASIMELYALCVINAFFVEESYFHLADAPSIDRTNPTFSVSNDLIKKLITVDKIEEFPLTRIIGTCPLILGLIRENNTSEDLLSLAERATAKAIKKVEVAIKAKADLDEFKIADQIAVTAAKTAITVAKTAITAAQTDATAAQTDATTAQTDATAAQTDATAAQTDATAAQTDATAAQTDLTAAHTAVTGAAEIARKWKARVDLIIAENALDTKQVTLDTKQETLKTLKNSSDKYIETFNDDAEFLLIMMQGAGEKLGCDSNIFKALDKKS